MLSRLFPPALLIASAWVMGVCDAAEGAPASGDEKTEFAAADVVLQRVPPKSPKEALASFDVADGFRIELVAAEPLVVDPVAMAFDEHGRLYVVEMCDYSEQAKERLGRVRLLVDENRDGQFETSHVFAEGLSWPTAVACYDGGVFVGAAPDILYCKDNDGDGVADEQRVVFTGFGRGNVQGLLNSFQWGLENRIHGATSSAGASVTRPGQEAAPFELRGRDFAFDPKTLSIAATTGGGQHGLSFNRWGDRFVCSNSDHLQAIVFEERYLARNPFHSVTSARRSIAADGPQAAVYRISPVEEWRVARTKLRVAGLAPGPIEGGGQAAGYFTSATGVTIYEGDLWDEKYRGWALVADVGSNLIHRKRLVPSGVTYRGERVDAKSEFVRSSDIWFRPVQMAIGPEGALYVADMYRETIEHPASLPAELKRQLDLTSGNDRGRIYRIVPSDYRYSAPRMPASLGTRELVQALDHPNAWRRATAARLVYERNDPAAVELLREQLGASRNAEGRIAVLYSLRSLGALTEREVRRALEDSHPQVRRHALRLSEPFLNASTEVRREALSLAADDEPVVRFQLALTLGECDDSRAAETIAAILKREDDQDVVDAALTSVGNGAGIVLKSLLDDRAWLASARSKSILSALVGQIVRQRREEDLAALVAALQSEEVIRAPGMAAMVKALARVSSGLKTADESSWMWKLAQAQVVAAARIVSESRQVLERAEAPLEERIDAVENLGLGHYENQRSLLEELLAPSEPAEIRAAVFSACADYDHPGVAELVLAHWEQLAPGERSAATDLLLRREVWALALVQHLLEEGKALATLEAGHVTRLENYPSAEVRELARSLRGEGVAADRREVFQGYKDVVSTSGDAAAGKAVFEKHCATCHQVDGRGHAVGPNLAAMVNRGAESILFNVLVPNGEVDPRYLEYVVVTVDGQVLNGIIAGETSTAVVLRGADNKTSTVLRVDIEEMHSSGKSLMPDGFEKLIDERSMADLLAYLSESAQEEGAAR